MPAPSQRTTIYDVADRARVAISTVSRVLNDSNEVSDATRQRVLEAIDELNFQPQRTARSLATSQSSTLAVAMPSFTSLFYVEILKGVKDVLRASGSDLLLCNLGSEDPDATLTRFLNRGAVGGLLLASLEPDESMRRALQRMQAPVVLIGARDDAFDSFWWDDVEGSKLAVRHLLRLGHRRVGLISAHEWSQAAAPRLEGYKAALAEAGIEFDERLVVRGQTTKHAGYSEEAGAEGMAQLLSLDDRPTAVFAASDVQAYGAWAHARNNGFVVPRDLSIVGYDDLKPSRFLDLTTVAQHMQDAGTQAAERLIARLSGEAEGRIDFQVELKLCERGSTAPLA
ncbi:MAG: LacI family DNA-binding transcriptional regulator [Bacteroidota bacterium]